MHLALDNGLQVSDTRVLREVAEGFSLEFGHVLLDAFDSGRDVGVDDAFGASESSRDRRLDFASGKKAATRSMSTSASIIVFETRQNVRARAWYSFVVSGFE